MKKLLLISLCLATVHIAYSQKDKNEIPDYAKEVFEAKEIIYYGWDFTLVKITDSRLIGEGNEIKIKTGRVLGKLSEKYPPRVMGKLLDKPLKHDLRVVQEEYFNRDFNNLISFSEYNISFKELKSLIASYSLSEKSGIGLVIVAESMNKPDGYSSSFVVFFDIKTREPIWTAKTMGEIKGAKFSNYYYYGFYKSFDNWAWKYKKLYKKYLKSH